MNHTEILKSINEHTNKMYQMEYEQKKMLSDYVHPDLAFYDGDVKGERICLNNNYICDGHYPIRYYCTTDREYKTFKSLNILGGLIYRLLSDIVDIEDLIGDLDEINSNVEDKDKTPTWEDYVYKTLELEYSGNKRFPSKTDFKIVSDNNNYGTKNITNPTYESEMVKIKLLAKAKVLEIKKLGLDFNRGAELLLDYHYPIGLVTQIIYHERKPK